MLAWGPQRAKVDPTAMALKSPESVLNATAMGPLTTLTNNHNLVYSHSGDFFPHLRQYNISPSLDRSEAHVAQRPV